MRTDDSLARERLGEHGREHGYTLTMPRRRSRRLETLLLVSFVVLVVAAFMLMLAGLIVLILAL